MTLRLFVLLALVLAAVLLAAPATADGAAHRLLKKGKKGRSKGKGAAKKKFVPPAATKMAMFTAASPCQATQAIFGWYSLQKSPAANMASKTPFHAARVVYADHATDSNKNGLGPWQDSFEKAALLHALAAVPKKVGKPLKKLVACVKRTAAAGLTGNPKAAGCDFAAVGSYALAQCVENLKAEFNAIDMRHPLSVRRDGHWSLGGAGNRGDKSHCALACIAAVASSSRDVKSCSVALTQLASKGDRLASMSLSSGANVVFPKPAWVPGHVQWHNAATPNNAAYNTGGGKTMRFWRDLYRRHADPNGRVLPAADDEADADVHAVFPPMGQRGSCSEDKIVAAEVAAIPSQTQ